MSELRDILDTFSTDELYELAESVSHEKTAGAKTTAAKTRLLELLSKGKAGLGKKVRNVEMDARVGAGRVRGYATPTVYGKKTKVPYDKSEVSAARKKLLASLGIGGAVGTGGYYGGKALKNKRNR